MNFAGVFFFPNLHEEYEESSPVLCEVDLPSPLELRDGL
jgi:hypothetical protein